MTSTRQRPTLLLRSARVLACLVCLALAFGAWVLQLLPLLLFWSLLFGALIGAVARFRQRASDRFQRGFARALLAGRARPTTGLHVLLRGLFWLVLAGFFQLGVVPAQLTSAEYWVLGVALPWSFALVRVACELRPSGAGHSAAVTAAMTLVAVALAADAGRFLTGRVDPAVELAMPGYGTWVVLQGGPGPAWNHHAPIAQQRHAVDLFPTVDGRDRRDGGAALEDYYCWDAPVLAPAAGTVAKVVDGQPDAPTAERDPLNPAGNHVVLALTPKHYVLLGHLKQGSIEVAVGDTVHPGQPLARCGNSGNSSQPHLHLQVQTRVELTAPDNRALRLRIRAAGAPPPERAPRRNDVLVGAPAPS
jgi:hypothetical protein